MYGSSYDCRVPWPTYPINCITLTAVFIVHVRVKNLNLYCATTGLWGHLNRDPATYCILWTSTHKFLLVKLPNTAGHSRKYNLALYFSLLVCQILDENNMLVLIKILLVQGSGLLRGRHKITLCIRQYVCWDTVFSFTCLKSPIHHINIYKLYTKMILRICPNQILNNKQYSHFLKTIVSIVNWLISRVKIHVQRKFVSFNFQCYQYNDDIS